MPPLSRSRTRAYRHVTAVCTARAAVIAACALTGWLLDVALLRTLAPGTVTWRSPSPRRAARAS